MSQRSPDWAWGTLGAVAVVCVVSAGALVSWAVARGEHERVEENRALALARATAYVAGHRPAAEVNDYLQSLRQTLGDELLEAYFLGTGEVNRLGMATGNRYRANLDRSLVGTDPSHSSDPRQRDLYNRTNGVLGALTIGQRTSTEIAESYLARLTVPPAEGLAGAAPYFQFADEVGPQGRPARNVNVPVMAPDGTLEGVAGITVTELEPPAPLPWLGIILIGLLAGAGCFALGTQRRRWALTPWAMLAALVAFTVLVGVWLGGWEAGSYRAHVGSWAQEANTWLRAAVDRTDGGAVDYALRTYRDARSTDLGAVPFAAESALREGGATTAMAIALALLAIVLVAAHGFLVRTFRYIAKSPWAYVYVVPSMIGMLVLVFGPFFLGVALAFHERDAGRFVFVGLGNFIRIFGGQDQRDVVLGIGGITFHVWEFGWTLGVTVLWTALNVIIHVVSGLALALVLNDPFLRFKRIYRVLLILPWAIPNYITALIWRAMFDTDNGAVNQILGMVGIGKVDWLTGSFLSAFSADLVTNCWLGFPFMMVISLGALQSIPGELYEAAEVDGATRWQKFRTITLPLLKPALFPAIILGSIWTFNMFNIIYLVSGGGPANNTEILITQAYKAFYNLGRWGYAAAYSVIIFLILLLYSSVMNRVSRATEGAFD